MKKIGFILLLIALVLFSGCGEKECRGIDCGEHGECVESACICDVGWTGPDCNIADPCAGINCNNGNCNNGVCDCNSGYEGSNCQFAFRDKYIGNYFLSESCLTAGAPAPYLISADTLGVVVRNFTFTGLYQSLTVSTTAVIDQNNSDRFAISKQAFVSGYEISGSGEINTSNSEITLRYLVYQTGNTIPDDSCSATLVRQ